MDILLALYAVFQFLGLWVILGIAMSMSNKPVTVGQLLFIFLVFPIGTTILALLGILFYCSEPLWNQLGE